MGLEDASPLKSGVRIRKGRFALLLAAWRVGVSRKSARVVLAFPGSGRYPLESGMVADIARRAAVLGAYLSETSDIDPWIYTSRAHRLPSLRQPDAAQWIEDWAVLPKKPLFTQDAVQGNPLARHARQYGVDSPGEDVAAAVGEIARSIPRDGVPTLVLFYLWAAHSRGALADRLREEADGNVFWLFVGNSPGNDVQKLLERLRIEATDIKNVHHYKGWEKLDDTPDYLFYRGVLKPFSRWLRRGGGER